jgi:glyoxylate utilization-related uncharacterized protein
MTKVTVAELKPYEAPGHFNMTALKLHEKEVDGKPAYWMGMSHFLPGGGANLVPIPMNLVYFVLEGEITVKSPTETIVLKKYDSLHIYPGDTREVINATNLPATMLVIM